MYLISAYFDAKSSGELNRLIEGIAKVTGNTFMLSNKVPPHLTITAFDTKEEDFVVDSFLEISQGIKAGNILIPTIGQLLPYVLYAGIVPNNYLFNLQKVTVDEISEIQYTLLNRFYKPDSWLPHITLAKTLDEKQMRQAFDYVQKSFIPLEATITEIGLAKTNPHRDIVKVKLD